jgi:hypothetical protein
MFQSETCFRNLARRETLVARFHNTAEGVSGWRFNTGNINPRRRILMEENTMVAFIKRFLRNHRAEHQNSWVYREERQQFELERQQWYSGQWLMVL